MMKRKAALGRDLSPNAALLLMTGALLLAMLAGALGLDSMEINADELNSVSSFGAFDDAHGALEIAALADSYAYDQMPLYYIIGAYWAQLTGYSHITLRLLSVLFGMLALAWLYALASQAFDRRCAMLAALLMLFSAQHLDRYLMMRNYTLVMLLATAHTWLYWQLMHRGRQERRYFIGLVLTAALFWYTHGFAALYFAGLGLYHLLCVKRTRHWWLIGLGWCAGLALFSPWLPQLVEAALGPRMFSTNRAPVNTLELTIVLGHAFANHAVALWLPLGLGMALHLRRERRGSLARLLLLALCILAVMAAADAATHFLEAGKLHYMLVMWHLIMIVFSAALLALPWRRIVVPLFLAVWIAAGIHALQPGFMRNHPYVYDYGTRELPPMNQMTRALTGVVADDDFLLGFAPSDFVNFDYPTVGGSFADYYLGAQLGIDGVFFHASDKKYRLKGDVSEILRARPHLLLAHDPGDPPPNLAPTLYFIEESFAPCPPLVHEPTLQIQKFRYPAMPCDHLPAGSVAYDNGIKLIDRAVSYDAQMDRVQALLWWEIPDESMLDDFNISLQLFAADGAKAGQVDRHLDAKLTPWGVVESPTNELRAGEYELQLIVYDRHTGAKLNGVDRAAGESGKLLTLLDFEAES